MVNIGDTTTKIMRDGKLHLLEAVPEIHRCDGCCLFGHYEDGEPWCDSDLIGGSVNCVMGHLIVKDRGVQEGGSDGKD